MCTGLGIATLGAAIWGGIEQSKARKEAAKDPPLIPPEAIDPGTTFPSSKRKRKRQPGLAQGEEDLGPLKLSTGGALGDPFKQQERAMSVFG